MLTDIVARDVPQRPQQTAPAPTELDRQILAAVTEPMRPTQIAQAVGRDLQTVARRLRVLRSRDQLVRVHPPGAAANGPGSTLYSRPPR